MNDEDVDEQSEVSFLIPQGTLSWQLILCAKSTPQSTHLTGVRVPSARSRRAARSATTGLLIEVFCGCNCCTLLGRRQTNDLIRWTQANQLTDNWQNNTLLATGNKHTAKDVKVTDASDSHVLDADSADRPIH